MNNRYNYEELKEKALKGNQEDINALGEWFEDFGLMFWNGEFFEIDSEHRLYRIEEEVDEDEWEVKGYEIR